MSKPAQSRASGEIREDKDILASCNGCGKEWQGTYMEAYSVLDEAFKHEQEHHENGHPEGFTVELRDET